MNKIWKFKNIIQENGNSPELDYDSFAKEIGSIRSKVKLPDIFIRLLFLRGIKTYSEFIKYFKSTIHNLHDPFLMKDMDIAVNQRCKLVKPLVGNLLLS